MMEQKTKSPYMLSLQDKILDAAMLAFAQKGIKAVRMDDIAQMLSISKRTLYEIYDNKEKLLFEGVKKYKLIKDKEFEKLSAESNNVMEIMLAQYRQKVEEFHNTSPLFYADITKYPSVVKFLNDERHQSHEQFIGFLQRGIREGYFRNDINLELISEMFSSIGEHIISHQLYNQYSMEELVNNLVLVSLRGFCSIKGIHQLDQYFGTNEE